MQIHTLPLEPAALFCQKPDMASESRSTRQMTDAQREYERKRAVKAGMSLDKWLDQKQKQVAEAAPKPAKPARKPGLLSRLLDRAHEPLKKKT
jgi:hypothetical protein